MRKILGVVFTCALLMSMVMPALMWTDASSDPVADLDEPQMLTSLPFPTTGGCFEGASCNPNQTISCGLDGFCVRGSCVCR